MKKFAQYLLIAIMGGMIVLGMQKLFFEDDQPSPMNFNETFNSEYQSGLAQHVANYSQGLPDFVLVSEMTVNAVVHIRTVYEQRNSTYDEFFNNPFREFFFGPQRQRSPQRSVEASGSGVIIGSDGYVVTNNHVVQDADIIEVTLNDNSTHTAVIVGTDPTTDLALIKIEAENLPYLEFGNSDEVNVGEWVLAVGNPFNLTSTVTAGIVSAKGRNINILGGGTAIESFIQTDAAVNRGNSGGALVNERGELIGINAAIASQTGSFSGYSFAIPSNIVTKVVEDILEYGEVQRGFMGVEVSELNSKIADELDLDIYRGALVRSVRAGGPADEAGIEPGDVIIGMDDSEIKNPSELIELSGRKRPGDKVKIKYYRNGKTFQKDVVMKNIHGDTQIVKKGEKDILQRIGADLETASVDEMKRLDIENGVKIVALRPGILRSAGIREGFIITHIDRKAVKSTRDVVDILSSAEGGVLIEGIYPNGIRVYYGIGVN
ncbi:MAG: Do family serine endopeptidase [Bacteroidota bacterium]